MSRLLLTALVAVTALPAAAQAPLAAVGRVTKETNPPEHLLSPTTQFYLRWDGIASHAAAYKASIWGGIMAGPTGDSVRALLDMVRKQLGHSLLSEPLLEGKSPLELKASLADLKNAEAVIDLIVRHGVVVGAKLQTPRPTLKGVTSALGGLLSGNGPASGTLMHEGQFIAIVPDVGEKSEAFLAAIRFVTEKSEPKAESFEILGRKGLRLAATPQQDAIQFAAWAEGRHFVLYFGTEKLESVLSGMTANAAMGGVTAHPLFALCKKDPGYEAVTRGFVDTAHVVSLARWLGGPFVPGLSQRLDDLGIGTLKAVVFTSGFDGRESRATYALDLPGERKGFARVLKREPFTVKDLPPLPPDVSRFTALRIDPAAAYDAGIGLIEALASGESFGTEEDAKTPAERIMLRRAYLDEQVSKGLGVNLRTEVLPHLGDRVVMYQSPLEGLSALGTVFCVSLKDAAKMKEALDRIQRGMDALLGAPIKVRKRMLNGVEVRELHSSLFTIFRPSYAIVGDWLVVGLHPQPVHGFVQRARGNLAVWRPDPATAARLAKMPADGCGLQYCDPRSTVQNLCCIGPLALSAIDLGLLGRANQSEGDNEPLDIGLIPNAHELSSHLFPNLTVTRDDGTTVRIEVNESFSLPLEAIGFEPMVLLGLFGGLFPI